jgi:hypothetical protein
VNYGNQRKCDLLRVEDCTTTKPRWSPRNACAEDTGELLDYVGGWPNASKVFIGLHRDGLTGYPQAHLSRGGLRTLAEDFRIKEDTLFHCATTAFPRNIGTTLVRGGIHFFGYF